MAQTIAATREAGPTTERDLPPARLLRTTPGKLRAASVVLVVAVVVLGVIAVYAAASRAEAANTVGRDAVPELVAAQQLYAELAATDAAASASYLSPGPEPAELRRRYLTALAAAGEHLARVARTSDASPETRRALRTITAQLPMYAGLIEAARANDRQGFTVGAAYLRQASRVMRDDLVPAATIVYEEASQRLGDVFDQGTSPNDVALVVIAAAVAVVLLLLVQWLVARRTHRVLNIGMSVATVLVVIVTGWTLVRFVAEQDALVAARREGSDAVQALSAMRILALRAHNDDNLALIDRGGGEPYLADYDTIERRLLGTNGDGGMLAVAEEVAARRDESARMELVHTQLANFTAAHRDVRERDDAGTYEAAVDLALTREAGAATSLQDTLRTEIARAQADLDDHAADAQGGFGLLIAVVIVLSLVGAALVLIGLQPRIEEYR